jgi:hypothetical protein
MAATTVTALLAATFIGSLGVNTHVDYTVGAYSNRTNTINAINYLGVKNLRDSPESSRAYTIWPAIAEATGSKFIAYMPRSSPTAMQQALNRIPQLKSAGVLNYIEGANEPETPPAIAVGNSLGYAKTFQQKVYAMGREQGLKVINLSVGAGWTAADGWQGNYDSIGNQAAYVDFANAHTYPTVTSGMPYKTVKRINDLAQLSATGRRTFITEMGWNTASFPHGICAKNLLNGLMDAALLGNAKTYIFALFDDASGAWGLMNDDGTPRLAGTAFRNLFTLLKDSGNITPGSLSFELTGVQTERRVLFRKADGAYWLAIWDEAAGARTITLKLGSNANSIKVYDPTNGTAAIQTVKNTNTASISVNDRPMLIRIAMGTTLASEAPANPVILADDGTGADKAVAEMAVANATVPDPVVPEETVAEVETAQVLPKASSADVRHEKSVSAAPRVAAALPDSFTVARSILSFGKISAFLFETPAAEEEAFLPDARAMPTATPEASGDKVVTDETSAQEPKASETGASQAAAQSVDVSADDEINPPDTLMALADEPSTESVADISTQEAATKGVTANPTAADAVIDTSASNGTVEASANTNMILVRGTGNTVNAGPLTTQIYAVQGKNIINASSGSATISISGSENEINIGTGTTRIDDNGQNTVIKFSSIGAGQTDVYGAILSQGTKLDFASILAGTEWDKSNESLGKYLRLDLSGSTTVISVVPSGLADGMSHPIAALHNVSGITLADLLRVAIVT